MGVLLICVGASEARAAYVYYSATGILPVTTANSPFTVKMDGTSYGEVYAATMVMTKTGGAVSMPASFDTDCVDFLGNVDPLVTYGYGNPLGFANQGGLDPSWGANPTTGTAQQRAAQKTLNEAAAIQAAAYIFYTFGLHAGYLTAPVNGTHGTTGIEEQEALQLAIWDALYDTTAGSRPLYNSGRYVITGGLTGTTGTAISSLIQTMINSVPHPDNVSYTGYLLSPSPTFQDGATGQEVFYNVTPVPEPTTIITGGLMLMPFCASTLRFLRKKRA